MTAKTMRLPSTRAVKQNLTAEMGREVLSIDVLPVSAGDQVTVSFQGASSPWRQGVWIATEGSFATGDGQWPQLQLWLSADDPVVTFDVVETDGSIRLYNIWDSGRGIKPYERLGYTSGMLRTDLPDGTVEYRCNDSGSQREFDRLVFTVRIT